MRTRASDHMKIRLRAAASGQLATEGRRGAPPPDGQKIQIVPTGDCLPLLDFLFATFRLPLLRAVLKKALKISLYPESKPVWKQIYRT